jgi:predicted RNA-binding protein with PIN domain
LPYLIDGNNLLGSWGGPAVEGDGRVEVVRRVAAFCRAKGARATIVFDGAPFRPELGGQQLGAVSVRFPPQGRDADSLIREIVDAAERPGELVVVTSDKPVYSYARTRGARAMSAREWNALGRPEATLPRSSPSRRRSLRAGGEPKEKPERETDVEGWLKKFSRE